MKFEMLLKAGNILKPMWSAIFSLFYFHKLTYKWGGKRDIFKKSILISALKD